MPAAIGQNLFPQAALDLETDLFINSDGACMPGMNAQPHAPQAHAFKDIIQNHARGFFAVTLPMILFFADNYTILPDTVSPADPVDSDVADMTAFLLVHDGEKVITEER